MDDRTLMARSVAPDFLENDPFMLSLQRYDFYHGTCVLERQCGKEVLGLSLFTLESAPEVVLFSPKNPNRSVFSPFIDGSLETPHGSDLSLYSSVYLRPRFVHGNACVVSRSARSGLICGHVTRMLLSANLPTCLMVRELSLMFVELLSLRWPFNFLKEQYLRVLVRTASTDLIEGWLNEIAFLERFRPTMY